MKFWKQRGCFAWGMLLVMRSEERHVLWSKNPVGSGGHVCQNDRKYYQRMIPTSFVLGLYDLKEQTWQDFVWFLNDPSSSTSCIIFVHHIHGISMSLRWSFVAGSAVTKFSLLEVPSPESSVKCESLKSIPHFYSEKILFKKGDFWDIFGRVIYFHKLCLFR